MEWKVSDTGEELGALLDSVDEHGPQQIRWHGKLYLVSPVQKETPRNRLIEILLNGPDWDDIEVERIRGTIRNIDL